MKTLSLLKNYKGLVILSALVLLGVALTPFHLPQNFYAWYVALGFFSLAVIDYSFAFLVFLFLTQAFLGESDKPYLFLIDLFVLSFLAVFVKMYCTGKIKVNLKEWWIVLPFIVSIILAFPLCSKEVILDYKIWGAANFLKFIWVSRPIFREYWFKEVLWSFTAFGLYLVVSRVFKVRSLSYCKKVWFILIIALVNVSLFGLLLYFLVFPSLFKT